MNLNALAKKAAKGAMEVEDMIRFVLFHGAVAADEIERLAKQHQWVMDGLTPDGARVAPFGRWALACVTYGREGEGGLIPMLRDPEMARFAVGILQEVRTPASVDALLDYCATAGFAAEDHEHPAWVEWQALLALNYLLALDDFVPVPQSTLDRLRDVAIAAYGKAANAHLRSMALAALRGAPSEATLRWAQELKPLDPESASMQRACVKALRKRLAPGFQPLNAEQKRQLRKERAADV